MMSPYDLVLVTVTLAGMFAAGFPVRAWLKRWHVPPAASLMVLGLLVGTSVADLLPAAYLEYAGVLSKTAFVVLLLRAGLGLTLPAIRRILGPVALHGTVPVAAEAACLTLLLQLFVFDDWRLCMLGGVLIAAVSPAVILPTMLLQKDLGRGARHLVPDRIMGQTVVNALIAQTGILLFLGVLRPDGSIDDGLGRLARLPLALAGGVAAGIVVGWLLRVEPILRGGGAARRRAAVALAIAVCIAVYFSAGRFGLESVFATLTVGVMLGRRLGGDVAAVRADLRGVWSFAEIVLFVNLGAQIDIGALGTGGLVPTLIAIILASLAVRLGAAWLASRATDLPEPSRRYTVIAHVPKATIQAVFGAVPLQAFTEAGQQHLIPAGQTLLIMAAVSILITAPMGAVLLDRLGERWLEKEGGEPDSS